MADLTREERNQHYAAIIAALGVMCAVLLTGTTVYALRYSNEKHTSETLAQRVVALENEKAILAERTVCAEAELSKARSKVTELTAENEELTRRFEETSFALDEVCYATGWTSLGEFRVTHYCTCEKCCGKWANGLTASGAVPMEGRTVAVDPSVIPLGTEIRLNGHVYVAEDTGVHGRSIDVFVNDHQEAIRLGLYQAEVERRNAT